MSDALNFFREGDSGPTFGARDTGSPRLTTLRARLRYATPYAGPRMQPPTEVARADSIDRTNGPVKLDPRTSDSRNACGVRSATCFTFATTSVTYDRTTRLAAGRPTGIWLGSSVRFAEMGRGWSSRSPSGRIGLQCSRCR